MEISFSENGFKTPIHLSSRQDIFLGKEDSLMIYEKEVLKDIVNPIQDFDHINFKYEGINQNYDLWFRFIFFDGLTYLNGLNFRLVNILPNTTSEENSFFKIDFYDKKDINSKLLSTKIIYLNKFITVYNKEENIFEYIPVIMSNNFKNKDLYNLQIQNDERVLNLESIFMSCVFFNSRDGSVTRFLNNRILDDNDGIFGSYENPIKFYQINENYNFSVEDDFFYKINLNKISKKFNVTL